MSEKPLLAGTMKGFWRKS